MALKYYYSFVQRWEHSPPTHVTVFNPDIDGKCGLSLICCWFSLLLWEVFSGFLGFPLSSKTNISKFQFDQEWLMKNHYVDVLPINCYLFIYLFTQWQDYLVLLVVLGFCCLFYLEVLEWVNLELAVEPTQQPLPVLSQAEKNKTKNND